MTETIAQKLDRLADWQAQRAVIDMDKQNEIDKILTAEIKAQLADLDAEFAPKVSDLETNITALTEEIKADVLQTGATVKGQYYMAVWNKGRVTWDSKKLDGMMALIPGLEAARKEGDPTITLRKI